MDTKACNLTKEEVVNLLISTGQQLSWPNANFNDLMERLNYFHKRLKAFEDKDDQSEVKSTNKNQASGFASQAQGWKS